MLNLLFTINLASSLFLTGLIWTIQCVHYPIFYRLDLTKFTEHISFHKSAISILVVPAMTIELGTSGWLAWSAPSYLFYHQAGLVTVILIWLITFFVQVPLHEKLSLSRNEKIINRLVKTNWLRTALWSFKTFIALTILNKLLQ